MKETKDWYSKWEDRKVGSTFNRVLRAGLSQDVIFNQLSKGYGCGGRESGCEKQLKRENGIT